MIEQTHAWFAGFGKLRIRFECQLWVASRITATGVRGDLPPLRGTVLLAVLNLLPLILTQSHMVQLTGEFEAEGARHGCEPALRGDRKSRPDTFCVLTRLAVDGTLSERRRVGSPKYAHFSTIRAR